MDLYLHLGVHEVKQSYRRKIQLQHKKVQLTLEPRVVTGLFTYLLTYSMEQSPS
jgi:hypothetical protein